MTSLKVSLKVRRTILDILARNWPDHILSKKSCIEKALKVLGLAYTEDEVSAEIKQLEVGFFIGNPDFPKCGCDFLVIKPDPIMRAIRGFIAGNPKTSDREIAEALQLTGRITSAFVEKLLLSGEVKENNNGCLSIKKGG